MPRRCASAAVVERLGRGLAAGQLHDPVEARLDLLQQVVRKTIGQRLHDLIGGGVGATGNVGTATLTPVAAAGAWLGSASAAGASAAAGGSGSVIAALGGVALGPVLVGVGGLVLVGVGVQLWRRHRKSVVDVEGTIEVTFDIDESEADILLAEIHSIIEAAAARMASKAAA